MATGRAATRGRLAGPASCLGHVRVCRLNVALAPGSLGAGVGREEKKMPETTFDGGSLGSRIDEERSQLR